MSVQAIVQPIYRCAEIRHIEARAAALPAPPRLMERAGLAAAQLAREMLGERGKSVLVFAGPGNNGGDAFELATHLKQWFYRVHLVFLGDAGKLPVDAARAWKKWRAAGGKESASIPSTGAITRDFGLVVDGLFGIGLARPPAGRHAQAIDAINGARPPVLALDIPSGLDGDTGAILGRAVRATRTLTFIGHKPGLLTLDGADCCGDISVALLGLKTTTLQAPNGGLLDASCVATLLPRRPRNFHKGNAGDVAILGGTQGMVGAALLAGRAALACGAGRVHVGLLSSEAPCVDFARPELMLRRMKDLSLKASVIAAGPGMGRARAAAQWLAKAVEADVPLVLDADALNIVATDKKLAAKTRERKSPTVLTPHPAEAGRLLGITTAKVQADRLAAALEMARRFNANVVLKGNGSITAAPDGRWWINTSGHPGMASAGMGDVLTGMVASLLAQGANGKDALNAAVWLHGAAGDALAAKQGGPLGTLAGDLIGEARSLLNEHLHPMPS